MSDIDEVEQMIPGYYSTSEVKSLFSWTDQRVNQAAKQEGWRATKVGNANLYVADDVKSFWQARRRMLLAAKIGRLQLRPLRDASCDTVCPQCGKFAVIWKGKTMCEDGHEG